MFNVARQRIAVIGIGRGGHVLLIAARAASLAMESRKARAAFAIPRARRAFFDSCLNACR